MASKMTSSKSKFLIIALLVLLALGAATAFLLLRSNYFQKHQFPLEAPELSPTQVIATTEASSSSTSTTSSSPPPPAATEPVTKADTTTTSTTASTQSPPDSVTIDQCFQLPSNLSRPQCDSKKEQPASTSRWYDETTASDPTALSVANTPLHYDLELRMNSEEENFVEGSVRVFLEIKESTSELVLHAGRDISDIAGSDGSAGIAVFRCSDGAPVCVQTVTRLIDRQLLIVALSEPVSAGTLLVLDISHFESKIPHNDGLFIQKPASWEESKIWMFGSLFENVGARSVFPCVDEKSTRASLELCLIHPSAVTVRGNMPSTDTTDMSDLKKTCFDRTPPLPPHQYGFIMFDGLEMLTPEKKSNQLEVFVGKHWSNPSSHWIISEIEQTIAKMTDLTGMSFAAPKLTTVWSRINMDGAHSLGIVLLKESWIEYPKYFPTHSILVGEVVEQWISNVLTICPVSGTQFCAQEGLATYLGWIILSEFESLNTTVRRQFNEARDRIIATEATRAKLRMNAANAFTEATECAERPALIFYMLENTYGRDAMRRFLRSLFARFANQNCASIEDMGQLLEEATGSSVARDMLVSFSNAKGYPVVRVEHQATGQLTIGQEPSDNSSAAFTLPVELLDDTLNRFPHVVNGTEAKFHKPTRFVILDPERQTYQRTLYNVENYRQIGNCLKTNDCAVERSVITNVFGDMCWALLENRLEKDMERRAQWHEFFGELASLKEPRLLDNDCNCCIRMNGSRDNRCKWIWQDKCRNLELVKRH